MSNKHGPNSAFRELWGTRKILFCLFLLLGNGGITGAELALARLLDEFIGMY